MDGLQISVQNFSSLRWHRNIWAVGAGRTEEVNWTDEITQTPLEALDKHNGSATGAASTVHLSGLVEDALWMRLGYASDEGNLAVEVRQFFHLFGIGGQDKWLYWDQGWSEPTSDTAVHKWTFKTVQAVATPALSDATGAVTVVISDIPQGTLMPNLMIGMIGGVWTVQIENVPGIMYTFVGGDPATQAMWVQEFAEQMFAEARRSRGSGTHRGRSGECGRGRAGRSAALPQHERHAL
jgi:hypothetical protein